MSARTTEILGVLSLLTRLNPEGLSISLVREARIAATKAVAASHEITHETVRDALTRQLHPDVQGIREFDRMVLAWRTHGSRELEMAVQRHAVDDTDTAAIRTFFVKYAPPV